MKLQVLRVKASFFIPLFLIVFFSELPAQVSPPSEWEQFVKDPVRNILVRDTFLFQSFEYDETIEWAVPVNADTLTTFKAYEYFTGEGNFRSLILRDDRGVKFELLPDPAYEDVIISALIGARLLEKGDSLRLSCSYRDGSEFEYTYFKQKESIEMVDFRKPFYYKDTLRSNPLQLTGDIVRFSLFFNSFSEKARVAIDSVLAYGNIPEYSLFRKKGNWQDTDCWSHLPVARHRKTLISADVMIQDRVECQEVHLGKGGLKIDPNTELITNKLIFHGDHFYMENQGEIVSRNGVTFEKTFLTKGEWYFISFPCDIYKKDIDPGFSLKDDKSDLDGDYFYILTYDGEKRNHNNSSSGNWQVVPESFPENQPLFEKGRGYLIALDKKATRQSLSFSSKTYLNQQTGQQFFTLPVSIPAKQWDTDEENYGWYLCGNPFPAPLAFSQIVSNESLDGYIYVYKGSEYTPYPIGGNYQIPPYGAFFVKAKFSTSLQIKPYTTDIPEQVYLKSYGMIGDHMEPQNSKDTPTDLQKPDNLSPFYSIKEDKLYIHIKAASGEMQIIDLQGRTCLRQKIVPAISVYDLNLPKGIYIINIVCGSDRFQDKFIINQ